MSAIMSLCHAEGWLFIRMNLELSQTPSRAVRHASGRKPV